MATSHEVEQYALFFKRKIMISIATILIRFASKEKKTAEEYTIEFQTQYLQLYDNINPLLKQRVLSFLQENLIQKLYKTVTLQSCNSNEDLKDSGDDLFNFSPVSKEVVNENLKHIEKEIKDSTDKNIQFIQAVIKLKTLVDKKHRISSSKLESILLINEDNESWKTPLQNVSIKDKIVTKNTDKDSRMFLIEHYNTNSVDYVQSNVLKFILQTSDTDRLLLHSANCVMKVIEYEIQYNAIECFNFWRGTLVEYGVAVLSVLCDQNEECFEMVYNFICLILENIWSNEEIRNDFTTEYQIHILGEFINNEELCVELMKFVSDKLESVLTTEKDKFRLAEKSSNMLSFCYKLFDSYKILTLNKTQTSNVLKEYELTSLWQSQFIDGDNVNESKTVQKEVIRKLIQVLERFVIYYINDCPLLAQPAVKCLSCIKVLDNIRDE